MAGWYHQHDKTRASAKKIGTAFLGRQTAPAQKPAPDTGLEEDHMQTVASYIGVYPEDRAERVLAQRSFGAGSAAA
jgi:hypothetical protein